jgi:hypothetical protein
MLSRIMRHPAGLVRKAFQRHFLKDAFKRLDPPAAAVPPAYWIGRYSNPGLTLLPPSPRVPESSGEEPAALLTPEAALLPAHGGTASSHLVPVPGKAAVPRP